MFVKETKEGPWDRGHYAGSQIQIKIWQSAEELEEGKRDAQRKFMDESLRRSGEDLAKKKGEA